MNKCFRSPICQYAWTPSSQVAALALGLVLAGPGLSLADPPPAPDVLTEGTATSWGASADDATAALFDDSTRIKVGAQSVRCETTAPFDFRMWAPAAKDGNWDLAAAGGPSFWIYAVNTTSYGFQVNSPWIRLATDAANYADYHPTTNLLGKLNTWIRVTIPLAGDATWQRTVTGSPNYTSINWIEIHADTWDAGFILWVDDFGFTTPMAPPQGLTAVAGNASVALAWQQFDAVIGQFNHYAVYRATSAFTSTVGRTPIATIADLATTAYTDHTAINGTSYYYAVTAVFTGGGETTQVESVGPRTPRDETDLQIVSIARTPRYPRYAPVYTYYSVTEPSGFGPYIFSAATGLSHGQNAGTPRWPAVGQAVTYTATVRNRGTNTWTTTLSGSWRLDGDVVASPSQTVSLAPGATTTFTYVLNWDDALHDISFTINAADARASNNSLTIGTKSAAFLSYIDQTYYDNFRAETAGYPHAATDDFIDWLNRSMTRFNEMFAAGGTQKRVHFDILEMLADTAPNPSTDTIYFAVFPFRYHANEGSLRGSGYYNPTDDIDYGLLHEMAHQLGLIDIYQLDMSADANQVSGQGYSAVDDLMRGCSPFLCPHSAGAMTLWLHKAHGYFGQYLYRIPTNVRLRLLGFDGNPLAGATVKMYQYCERPGQGKVITNQLKATGTTDLDGVWTLPNVPLNSALVPPAFNGDELHDNPFGYVAVVGTNGVLHFRIEYGGGIDYCWLDITECNVAYFQGQTQTATFERQLGLGGPIQYTPPADMTELNAADWTAYADGSTPQATYVTDDTTRKQVGAASIKFVTDGGFDTYLRYPRNFTALWNLTGVQTLNIRVYAVNTTIGFQNGSPWIRLKDADGNYFQYQYYSGGNPSDLLNQARNQWRTWQIPLEASPTEDNGWRRTATGAPDLTRIQYLEIHADTWDSGFTLWYDGVSFTPQPTRTDLNHDGQVDSADYDLFAACVTGPLAGALTTGCGIVDFDGDSDVDMNDFGIFQRCYGWPDLPPQSGCQD